MSLLLLAGFVFIIALVMYQHYLVFDRIDRLQNDLGEGKVNTTDFNTFHIIGIVAILALVLIFWKGRQNY